MDAAFAFLVVAVMGVNAGTQPESDAPPATAKRHTSYFAGQSGWSSDPTSPPPAAAPPSGRYGFGTTSNGATISTPQSVFDRAQSAVTETGNALRDGVEAGIQSANQQITQGSQQVIDSTRNASQQVSNQFQGWAGTTAPPAQIAAPTTTSTMPPMTNSRQQVSNPFTTSTPAATSAPAAATARNGVAPPPNWGGTATTSQPVWATGAGVTTAAPRTATLPAPPVQTDSGWTSVHSTMAPPAMAKPRLVNTAEVATPFAATSASPPPLQPMVGDGGPNFPAAVSANQPMDHSVLTQPQQPPVAAAANENWGLGWDGKTAPQPAPPVMNGNRYDSATISSGSGAPRDVGFTTSQQPAAQSVTVHSQGSQPAQTVGIGAFDRSPWPENPSTTQTGPIAVGPPPSIGSTAAVSMPQSVVNTGLPLTTAGQTVGTTPSIPPSDQLPWMPLLVVSLALAGSIGANLFLGYSYADARFKYLSLVQKTASKFRRAVT